MKAASTCPASINIISIKASSLIESGTAIDWQVFVLVAFHTEQSVAESETHDDCDDDVSVIGHNEHHCANMEQGVCENVEKSKDMLGL
jgi:hypothetical protein